MKDIVKMNELNTKLQVQIKLRLKMEELGHEEDVLKIIDNNIEDIKKDIHYEEHRRAANGNVNVKFIESGKVFYNKTAIETYKQSIDEFGLDSVKSYFPGFFAREKNDSDDYVALDINTYLYRRVSCKKIKENIEAISDKLRVRVTVTLVPK